MALIYKDITAFQVSGFRFQVSGFRFQVSGFRFQVSGFRFQHNYWLFNGLVKPLGIIWNGSAPKTAFPMAIRMATFLRGLNTDSERNIRYPGVSITEKNVPFYI